MGVYILRIYMNICVAIFCCKLKNSLKLKRFLLLPPPFLNYVWYFMFLLIRFVYTHSYILEINVFIHLCIQVPFKKFFFQMTFCQIIQSKKRSYLVTVVTLIGLFSTVCPLVSFHVVLLNKSHSALIAAERLFT